MLLELSVKHLLDYTLDEGDINAKFTAGSSAQEGIKGHQKLQKSRNKSYVAEKSVKHSFTWADCDLILKGRLDGYVIEYATLIVDEIKTIRVPVDSIPLYIQRQHWAQLKIYAYLLVLSLRNGSDESFSEKSVNLRLCYFDLDDEQEHQLLEVVDFSELEQFVFQKLSVLIAFVRAQAKWFDRRDSSLVDLKFPFGGFRAGQREMAVSTYKAFQDASEVVIQAPTGIGKTIASLFPALNAMSRFDYEKIFYLSAKTSGQQMAQDALNLLKRDGAQLRDIKITAKDKVCLTKGAACEPDQCIYAKNYYQKLPAVRANVLEKNVSLDQAGIEVIAKQNTMCPFELSLDLAVVSDVIVCDYNYVFDPTVYLRRFFNDQKRSFGLLLDECHNLPDRARDMFSAEISKSAIMQLRKKIKTSQPLLAKQLAKINQQFLKLLSIDKQAFAAEDGLVLAGPPKPFLKAITDFVEVAEACLQEADNSKGESNHLFKIETDDYNDLLQCYFDAVRLLRMAEQADKNYCFFIYESRKNNTLDTWFKVYCLNPFDKLADRFSQIKAKVCFSATLTPKVYFERLIGLSEEANWYQVESPFKPERLGVFTATYLDTSYKKRTDSLYELVDTLYEIVRARPGNYLVFLPSYAYLREVSEKFIERHGSVETIIQAPSMSDEARETFLAAFKSQDEGGVDSLLGFALIGGVFGEGVDLKGTRLIGALIVGVGLPQIGLERNLIRDYFNQPAQGCSSTTVDNRYVRSGFEFAYQYPGMNRVLQTAGRVIRTESDRGIVCLLEQRFAMPGYSSLLPNQWRTKLSQNRQQLIASVDEFWRDQSG